MTPWPGGELYEGAPNPGQAKIKCGYIHEAGVEMKLWKMSTTPFVHSYVSFSLMSYMTDVGFVRLLNRFVPEEEYPSQEDIDTLCNNEDFAVSPCSIYVLFDWLKNYKRVKAQTTTAQYMKTRPDVSFTASYDN